MRPAQSLELSHPPALTDPYPPNQILPIWLSFWFCLDAGSQDLANKIQVLTLKQLFVIDLKCKSNWASYIHHGKQMGKQQKQRDFTFLGSKITADVDGSHEVKTLTPWKKSYGQPRQHIKKQRHYFVNKGPSSESYGFSGSHAWM